jgi:hypothetical protein
MKANELNWQAVVGSQPESTTVKCNIQCSVVDDRGNRLGGCILEFICYILVMENFVV